MGQEGARRRRRYIKATHKSAKQGPNRLKWSSKRLTSRSGAGARAEADRGDHQATQGACMYVLPNTRV